MIQWIQIDKNSDKKLDREEFGALLDAVRKIVKDKYDGHISYQNSVHGTYIFFQPVLDDTALESAVSLAVKYWPGSPPMRFMI